MNLIQIDQDGKIAFVNPDHVILVIPSNLIGTSQLVLSNGVTVAIKGTVAELAHRIVGEE